ncbi:MAG: restriction endonuclease subunit S [Alphaproteobacteria bacterium]|nr:restriction endonuclease subunit S [Alphaproteobacteria bacterium]
MDEWKRAMLGEVADLNWGDTKTTKAAYVPEGYTAFSASGPDGFLPYHDYDRTGVVLSAIGSECGKTWLARGKWSCIKNTIRYFSKSKEVDTEFLYWATRSSDYWPKRGSGQPFISQGDARSCVVSYPPLPEQRAIAATLGALDDKIELNRKMNATLEAMARALFRDWFVDFGPTRAKMEGLAPYLAPDLWSLFPDRLDAEGKPEGWEVRRLEQIAEHHKRTLSPSNHLGRMFQHFSLPAFDRGQSPALDLGETIKSNKTLVPPDAVLLSKLNPEIPRVWLPEASSGTQQIASTEFLAFTGKQCVGRSLLFCLFCNVQFREMLQSMVTGTSKSHQRISPRDLLRREVLTGSEHVIKAFEALVSPILDQILSNRAQSSTLAQTRDLLLPRLMSGELRVAHAEQLVAGVA